MFKILLPVALLLAAGCCPVGEVQFSVLEPKTENRYNPSGIDTQNPLFSWRLSSGEQKSCRIVVSDENGSVVWDSGTLRTCSTIGIRYEGERLRPSSWYTWKVRVKGSKGTGEAEGRFLTGVFREFDWAPWIGLEKLSEDGHAGMNSRLAARYFRFAFNETRPVRSAVLHIGTVGLSEVYLNGKNADPDQIMAPVPSDFAQSANYLTYDVTNLMSQGKNVLGVILGGGYCFNPNIGSYPDHNIHYGYPKFRCMLVIRHTDGSEKVIRSSSRWMVSDCGPIRANNLYDGEIFDATRTLGDWLSPDYEENPSLWRKAELTTPGGKVMMQAQKTSGIKVIESLPVVSMSEYPGGGWLLDFGRNITGVVSFNVLGARGNRIRFDFAEKLFANGLLDKTNLRDSKARDIYICNGDGVESHTPKFVYHGFRYAVVSGLTYKPAPKDFKALFFSDDVAQRGRFRTDNKLVDKIIDNALTSIRGTYKGFPLDCPQRSKRLPWLGDRCMESLGETYLLDNGNIYENWLTEIRRAQKEDGNVPDVAPAFFLNYTDNVSWPSLFLFGSKMLYTQFGNARALEENYDAIRKWLLHIDECYGDEDGFITRDRYGDWGVPPERSDIKHSEDSSRITDPILISSAYYYKCMQDMEWIAGFLGRKRDEREYRERGEKIAQAFNGRFYNAETHCYSNNTVTANILPLAFGLHPENDTDAIVANLKELITEKHCGVYSSGVIGLQFLMRTLSRYGLGDVAYKLVTNTGYPSFGYMIEQGATSIWEYWNGDKIVDSSHNHVMLLGDLIAWCFEDVAGLRTEYGKKGLIIHFKPDFLCGFGMAEASLDTPQGPASSHWRRVDGNVEWSLTIPPGSYGIVHIPGRNTIKLKGGNYEYAFKI